MSSSPEDISRRQNPEQDPGGLVEWVVVDPDVQEELTQRYRRESPGVNGLVVHSRALCYGSGGSPDNIDRSVAHTMLLSAAHAGILHSTIADAAREVLDSVPGGFSVTALGWGTPGDLYVYIIFGRPAEGEGEFDRCLSAVIGVVNEMLAPFTGGSGLIPPVPTDPVDFSAGRGLTGLEPMLGGGRS